jgi:hypothetical protein
VIDGLHEEMKEGLTVDMIDGLPVYILAERFHHAELWRIVVVEGEHGHPANRYVQDTGYCTERLEKGGPCRLKLRQMGTQGVHMVRSARCSGPLQEILVLPWLL